MSLRQLRKRKAPPVSHVPCILDDIFVRWELDGKEMWWPASVIAIEKYDAPTNNFYGEGRLLYKRFQNYCEEESDVKFLFTPRRGHILYQHYNDKQLQMSWSNTNTSIAEPVSNQRRSVQEASSSKVNSGRVQRAPIEPSFSPINEHIAPQPEHNDQASVPENTHRMTSSRQVVPQLTTPPSTQTSLSNPSTPGPASLPLVNAQLSSALLHDVSNSAVLLIKQLFCSTHSCIDNLSQSSFHAQLASLFRHELRVDLVTEMHRNFRAPTPAQTASIDLQQKCIRISTPCSLQTFSFLAKHIESMNDSHSTHFFPSYIQTQNPSVSSERFTVYFNGIHSLGKALGFNDNRDFATLYWREKCYDNVLYTRILGSLLLARDNNSSNCNKSSTTTLVDKKTCTSSTSFLRTSNDNPPQNSLTQTPDSKKLSNDVDAVFVGLSMEAKLDLPSEDATEGETVNANQEGPTVPAAVQPSTSNAPPAPPNRSNNNSSLQTIALTRRRTLWDDETNSYLSHWECQSGNVSTKVPPADFFSRRDKKLENVFALRWEAKQIPRTTAWTSDAFRSDNHILGKVEVFVPWVLMTGDQCAEVGDILSRQTFRIRP